MIRFSARRLWAIIIKEFIQMKRDRLTFGMIIGIPIMQLILFGFAINYDPKDLPTVVVTSDYSPFTRDLIVDLQNSKYFKILPGLYSQREAEQMIARGDIQFAMYIPQSFTQKLIHNNRPQVLVEADATDPAATSYALNVVQALPALINKALTGELSYLQAKQFPIDVIVQSKYNPERITQYNIVPGLLGVVLTMTMVMITALAITRERERGTMEALLAMPVRPIEVMLGKVVPYILVGYIQVTLILLAAYFIFNIPFNGSLILLYLMCLPFIAANLGVGLTFSTFATNQLQAVQLAFFFFLPSILLSGFLFPFRGMPVWAQYLGETLPLSHFLLIVRGILLKGNGFLEMLRPTCALIIFFVVVLGMGLKRYRQTLD